MTFDKIMTVVHLLVGIAISFEMYNKKMKAEAFWICVTTINYVLLRASL